MKIYIAAPYRHPDPVSNTHRAALAWHVLWEAGYVPVCPHVSLVLDLVKPLEPEDWLKYDLKILETCNLLLRLPGFSLGADGEVLFCKARGIPVFEGTAEQFIEADIDLERFEVKRVERGQ